MKRMLLTLSLFLAPLAAHAFEGAVDYKMNSGDGKDMNMTYRVKGDRLRMEFNMPDGKGQGAMLHVPAEHAAYMLIPSQKMAMRQDTKKAEARLKKQMPDKTEFAKTGRTETIAGMKCDVYTFKTKDAEGETCNAEGMGSFHFANAGRGEDMPQWAQEAAARGQFPLRVTAKGKDGKVTSMIATKIDKSPQPDALFTVPSDYKIAGGGAPGAPAAKGAQNTGAFNPAEMAQRMQNASPEERAKMMEEMKKQYGAQ